MSTVNAVTKAKPDKKVIGKLLSKYVLILVLMICIGIFTSIQPLFFSMNNFVNILLQNSYLIVATAGVAIIMISGGTDLAVSYEMALASVVMAIGMMWWGLPMGVAILLGIVIATLMGTLNGYLAVRLNIHPMMVTLATMAVFQGAVFLLTKSQSIFNLPAGFKFIGQGFIASSLIGEVIPMPVVIMILVILAVSFMLNKTYLGRFAYAVGSNPEASRLSGINVGFIKILLFSIGGFIIGIASMMLLARSGSANATMALGTEFNAITACVLGGISLKGGEGKLWGAVVGVLILGVLANGMQLIGLGVYPQYIAKGVILIAAIGFDTYQKSKSKRR